MLCILVSLFVVALASQSFGNQCPMVSREVVTMTWRCEQYDDESGTSSTLACSRAEFNITENATVSLTGKCGSGPSRSYTVEQTVFFPAACANEHSYSLVLTRSTSNQVILAAKSGCLETLDQQPILLRELPCDEYTCREWWTIGSSNSHSPPSAWLLLLSLSLWVLLWSPFLSFLDEENN